MLINFKVKNYRSIKDEVVLDLQATNDKNMYSDVVFENSYVSVLKSAAIYGPNASGKSNILKAINVFRLMILSTFDRANANVNLPNEYFKLSLNTRNKNSFFEMTFLLDKKVFIYGFEMGDKEFVREWLTEKKGKKKLFTRDKERFYVNRDFKEGTRVLQKNTLPNVLFLSLLSAHNGEMSQKIINFIRNIKIVDYRDKQTNLDYSFEYLLNDKKRAQRIKEFVEKADTSIVDIKPFQELRPAKDFPDELRKFLNDKKKEGLYVRSMQFFHKQYNQAGEEVGSLPLNFMHNESEGTKQMFRLSAFVIDALDNGSPLFIDEINGSLHPLLCLYIISIFNSKKENPNNGQLIFTTHDLTFLDRRFFRRDQIYFTKKNKKDETKLFSLDDVKERNNVDFRKRYLEGRYGALPYIKDYENLKFDKEYE